MSDKMGYFISFEGLDGSGKSTQANLLKQHFSNQGKEVLLIREPGGTEFGEDIRTALLKPRKDKIHPKAQLMAFLSSRAQLIYQVILPALKRGAIVIADRFIDSSIAYQGFAEGLGSDYVTSLHVGQILGLRPDITFFLNIGVEESLQRRDQRNQSLEYFEMQTKDYFESLQAGFEWCAQHFSKRFKIIEAKDIDINQTFQLILTQIQHDF